MKNLLFTFLLFVGVSALSTAQSVAIIEPIPASATGTMDDVDIPTDAEIHNMTNTTIHMKWERQIIDLTPGCETAVCDPNLCWARHVGAHDFDMDPNTMGAMLVHFYPNGAPCEGIVHVKVTNRDNPDDTNTGIYLLNQNTGTKDLPAANVKLYPNPATEYFSLENAENVAAIRLFSLEGRLVARFDATTGTNFYSLVNQPVGVYVIALEDKNGRTFQALEVTKK